MTIDGKDAVKDPKGLVINYWNRYMKHLNVVITTNDLWRDLNQEIELIAWEIRHYPLKEAGRHLAKMLRTFLWNIGMRKKNGTWVCVESGQGRAWWMCIGKKNQTPDGLPIIHNMYDCFNGTVRKPRKENNHVHE